MVAAVKPVNGLKYLLEFGDQLVVLFHSLTPVAVPLGCLSAMPLAPIWRSHLHGSCRLAAFNLPFPTSNHTLLKLTLGDPRLPRSFRVLLGITACRHRVVVLVPILGSAQRASLADWGDRGGCGDQTAHWRREQVRGQLEVVRPENVEGGLRADRGVRVGGFQER